MRNNKKAGNKTELYFLKKLEPIHKEKLYTTRNISTFSDSKKIDLENSTLSLPLKYQVKQSQNTPKFWEILTDMDEKDINVVLYQKTVKKNDRFYKQDDYAIMRYEDFEIILEKFLSS